MRLRLTRIVTLQLGHFGFCTTKYEEMLTFYTSNFFIVPSDFIYAMTEGKKTILKCFAHLDLGETAVDHHSFFLSANPTTHVHHCSFEVHDFDTQQLGHQWLAERGYKSVWAWGVTFSARKFSIIGGTQAGIW